MSESTHSPLPWSYTKFGRVWIVLDAKGVGAVEIPAKDSDSEARCAMIVESVNGYAALTERVVELTAALKAQLRHNGCVHGCLYHSAEGNVHAEFCNQARALLSEGKP